MQPAGTCTGLITDFRGTSSLSQLYVTSWDVTTYNAYAADRGRAPYREAHFDPVVGYDPDPTSGGSAPFPVYAGGRSGYFLRAATDSASSATAYATGAKTDSGNIAWQRGDPPGGQLQSIVERMQGSLGASIGVITTVAFKHATPLHSQATTFRERITRRLQTR